MDRTTGLFTLQELEDRFLYEAGKINRYGGEKGLEMSLVFIKLHGLDIINREKGWAAGDIVLHSMTDALRTSLRSVDAAARMGRTSFGVLLPETCLGGVPAVLEKIRRKVSPLASLESTEVCWKFGWTIYEPGSESLPFWKSFVSRNGVMKGWAPSR